MLSVVIATKDRAEFLARTLDSLETQTGVTPFEVLVVDNGSRDRTAALVEERRAAVLPFTLRYAFVAEPNRAKARNTGIIEASGNILVFVDDDILLPERFLASHAAAHAAAPDTGSGVCVNGPIINVPSYDINPKPTAANYSGAFLCTCNASVTREALLAVGAFDERFDLYGWEDTDLGLRLRRRGVYRAFAWNAYLYHIKPPHTETLESVLRKNLEKARMAARLLEKDHGLRARLATGAYEPNLLRGRLLAPEHLLPMYAGIAQDERFPGALRGIARALLLDGAYTNELQRTLKPPTRAAS
jgi:glycosyltransferase involved in cell wall biosynthesis